MSTLPNSHPAGQQLRELTRPWTQHDVVDHGRCDTAEPYPRGPQGHDHATFAAWCDRQNDQLIQSKRRSYDHGFLHGVLAAVVIVALCALLGLTLSWSGFYAGM